MSEEAPPNPIPSISQFNTDFFFDKTAGLDFITAGKYFLKLSGGSVGYIDSSLYKYAGSIIDFSSIIGVSAGTASASKALITNASNQISGIASISATSMTITGGLLNATVGLVLNNTLMISGGTLPSTGNYMSMRFIPISSTGVLRAYNYVLSQYNHIAINDDMIYVKSSGLIGLGNTSPTQRLHVTGNQLLTGSLLIGDSSDTTRAISCLDSGMPNGTSKYITLGKSNTSGNQAEISYSHTSDGNLMNKLTLGLHSNPLVYIVQNGGIGLSQPNPQFKLDVNGTSNFTDSISQDGLEIINTSGQWVGAQGVNTTGRIVSSAALGLSQTNSGFASAEARIYCGSGFAYFGNNSNTLLRMGTNNEDFIICKRNSNGRKATTIGGDTNDTYMLTVSGSLLTRYNSSGYGWFNSSGNSGTGSDTVTDSCAFYCNGRILCVGEIDCISDVRRKSNIESLDDAFVDKFINEAVPKQFNYDNSVQKSIGYIAQAVYKLNLEGLVSAHPNEAMAELIDDDGFVSPAGSELSVSTGSIIPILHQKIKRMDADMEFMKQTIDALEEQVVDLEQSHEDDINWMKQEIKDLYSLLYTCRL